MEILKTRNYKKQSKKLLIKMISMHLKTSWKIKVLMKMKFTIFLQKIINKFGEKFKFKVNLKIN